MENTENTPVQEERAIIVYSTKGKKKLKINTNAATWGELQPVLKDKGYDLGSLHATESIKRSDLVNDNAILPAGAFVIVMRPKKTKSGADRSFKECRAYVKEMKGSKDEAEFMAHINSTGVNYTRLKADALSVLITSWEAGDREGSVDTKPKAKKKDKKKDKKKKKASKAKVEKKEAPKKSVAESAASASKNAADIVESVKESKGTLKSRLTELQSKVTEAIDSDLTGEEAETLFNESMPTLMEALDLFIGGDEAAREAKRLADEKAEEARLAAEKEEEEDQAAIDAAMEGMGF